MLSNVTISVNPTSITKGQIHSGDQGAGWHPYVHCQPRIDFSILKSSITQYIISGTAYRFRELSSNQLFDCNFYSLGLNSFTTLDLATGWGPFLTASSQVSASFSYALKCLVSSDLMNLMLVLNLLYKIWKYGQKQLTAVTHNQLHKKLNK